MCGGGSNAGNKGFSAHPRAIPSNNNSRPKPRPAGTKTLGKNAFPLEARAHAHSALSGVRKAASAARGQCALRSQAAVSRFSRVAHGSPYTKRPYSMTTRS